jgi:phosphatidate cytidylyltransferase
VTRVLSGAVLVALAIAAVWASPAWLFLVVAEVLVVLACRELAGLARAASLQFPTIVATIAAVLTSTSFAPVAFGGSSPVTLDLAMMTAFVTLGGLSLASWRGRPDALATMGVSLLPALYIGLPIGAMIAIRESDGPSGLFLLMATVMVSDSAQYYTGRAFGRRPLAPQISPKKTVEGAFGGFIFGAAFLTLAGQAWLPRVPVQMRLLLGLTVVALGIAGDLFESMLKRSAGVKDSSGLIPGHGGVLDRIDALLFAAPVYYVVLKYA